MRLERGSDQRLAHLYTAQLWHVRPPASMAILCRCCLFSGQIQSWSIRLSVDRLTSASVGQSADSATQPRGLMTNATAAAASILLLYAVSQPRENSNFVSLLARRERINNVEILPPRETARSLRFVTSLYIEIHLQKYTCCSVRWIDLINYEVHMSACIFVRVLIMDARSASVHVIFCRCFL